MFLVAGVEAAEWKTEPSLFLRTQYNDNVSMRAESDDPQGSTGFTLDPRVKFVGVEQRLWDLSLDARGKITKFQDVEDADSENIFLNFDSGRQTERSEWRLSASYEDNSNFDTDFDTQRPDAGLIDDRTQSITTSISPSFNWSMSENSQIRFSINATDVKYEEVLDLNYKDYKNNSAQFVSYWLPQENHQLGFTVNYSEYDSPDASFSYDQSVIQVDYTYTINPTSDISLSLGGRKLESVIGNAVTGCEAILRQTGESLSTEPIENFADGVCPASNLFIDVSPVLGELENSDEGAVTNFSYNNKTETIEHGFSGGRTVQPSSFGSAQEVWQATYKFSIKNTERFTTKLLIDAYKTEAITAALNSATNDNKRYRFEPSISYKLNKNWNIDVLYRYINLDRDDADERSVSNSLFVNLYLHWPRLTTTY